MGRRRRIPFDELSITRVVNDVVNDVPPLVTFDDGANTGVVFSPTVDGKLLGFQRFETTGGFLMEDLETGTVWDPLTGVALEGPLAGAKLEQVASHYKFWFAWRDYRAETELYQSRETQGTAP